MWNLFCLFSWCECLPYTFGHPHPYFCTAICQSLSCCTQLGSLHEKRTRPFVTWHYHQSLPRHFCGDHQLLAQPQPLTIVSSDSRKPRAGEYGGSFRLYFQCLLRRDIADSLLLKPSLALAYHLIGMSHLLSAMRQASFIRLKADGEGGPARLSWTDTGNDRRLPCWWCAFWLQCLIMLDGMAWKSVWTNFDSLFSR